MPNHAIHSSRLPALATDRQQLRQMKKHKPESFTAEHAERLDEATDRLILAMAHQIARLDREVQTNIGRLRRGH